MPFWPKAPHWQRSAKMEVSPLSRDLCARPSWLFHSIHCIFDACRDAHRSDTSRLLQEDGFGSDWDSLDSLSSCSAPSISWKQDWGPIGISSSRFLYGNERFCFHHHWTVCPKGALAIINKMSKALFTFLTRFKLHLYWPLLGHLIKSYWLVWSHSQQRIFLIRNFAPKIFWIC